MSGDQSGYAAEATPRGGTRSKLVIAVEDYAHQPDDILLVLKQAKAGFVTEPAQKPSNALYAFLAIPASCITLGISIIGLAWIALR
jgi:hypothetical protein